MQALTLTCPSAEVGHPSCSPRLTTELASCGSCCSAARSPTPATTTEQLPSPKRFVAQTKASAQSLNPPAPPRTLTPSAASDVADFLLNNGAHVDCRDKFAYTPLMNAASRGKASLVALLLTHNPDVRLQVHPPSPRSFPQQRCICVCCDSTDIWFHLSCFVFLIPALQARNGNTALDIARSHARQGAAALLQHHARCEIAACATSRAVLHVCLSPLSSRLLSSMLGAAVSRTAATGGLHPTQRFRLLLSGGSTRLLVSRMIKRNDAGCPWRVLSELSLLLLKPCAAAALA